MLKELYEFKKCRRDLFYVFFDDEREEDFWNRSVSLRLFDRRGYDVRYISGRESRLCGHLGGFIQYKKKI